MPVQLVKWNPKVRPATGWNPRVRTATGFRRLREGERMRNFGDEIGPLVLKWLLGSRAVSSGGDARTRRLLTVGSIVHLARDGDTLWGTGVNGTKGGSAYGFSTLDVRAVRGPLTREWLWREKRIPAPALYGDPAVLLPLVAPEWFAPAPPAVGETVIPNHHDFLRAPGRNVRTPRRSVRDAVEIIRASEHLVTSSLHTMIVAELSGRPYYAVRPQGEDPFKYDDYFAGVGGDLPAFYPSFADAFEDADAGAPGFAPRRDFGRAQRALLGSFPWDLWEEAAA